MRLIDADKLIDRMKRMDGIVNLPYFIREIEKSETVALTVDSREEYDWIMKHVKEEKDEDHEQVL